MAGSVRVRIAPSPTGYVHVGNTYIAYFNYIFARQHPDSVFIVRLDDTDRARHVADAEQVIYRLWKWLGLAWQEGADIGGPFAPYRQSERLDRYHQAANDLIEGDLAYKKDGAIFFKIQPGEDIIVDDLIRGRIPFERKNLKDYVIIKSDSFPTYQFATSVDEIDHHITHVIRGEDHLSNTPIQMLLIEALGGTAPIYAHLPLLRNPDQSKLSKRQGHVSLQWYHDEGFLPEALKNFFALMGWSHPDGEEVFTEAAFLEHFSFDRFKSRAPVFDLEKLRWLNGVKIRELSAEKILTLIEEYYNKFDQAVSAVLSAQPDYAKEVVGLTQERLTTLKEFWPLAQYFFTSTVEVPMNEVEKLIPEVAVRQKLLEAVVHLTEKTPAEDWKAAELETAMRTVQTDLDLKPKAAFMTIRLVVTGSSATPPLFDTLEVLGRDRVRERIQHFLTL